ncbi:MAG TPA: protein-L-isoaspartate O-methyltransferase [Arenimonas sp.]|nr:protein-L-isoaspartate O-methyltransferase [Arenimonas sp.]
MSIDFEQARFAMIEQQVRPWQVLDQRVLAAMTEVPREDFVLPQHRKLAFADLALPLEHGEFMLKPVLEGRMLQSLDLQPEDEVLLVGTGSGYMTACLARLARDVLSVDRHGDFVERVRQRLASLGASNARVEQADALHWQPGRQFDAICVTGALAREPEAFRGWLKDGGRLLIVRGESPSQEAVRIVRRGDSFVEESLFETDIPYLHGAAPAPQFTL